MIEKCDKNVVLSQIIVMMQTTMSCVDGMEETAVAAKDPTGTLTATIASAWIQTIQQPLLQ